MFTGNIYAVAVRSNGRILVGGAFTDFNGVGRSGIVELNPDGIETEAVGIRHAADRDEHAIAFERSGAGAFDDAAILLNAS